VGDRQHELHAARHLQRPPDRPAQVAEAGAQGVGDFGILLAQRDELVVGGVAGSADGPTGVRRVGGEQSELQPARLRAIGFAQGRAIAGGSTDHARRGQRHGPARVLFFDHEHQPGDPGATHA
jgi:hypothetical protein